VLEQVGRHVLVLRQLPRVHDAHVEPGPDGVVQEHRVHRSRTTSLPRNENDRLLMPPLTRAPGQAALIARVASMNATA